MLAEDKRAQLDGIVNQMISNKESDEDIQFVVNDFKGKYDAPAMQTQPAVAQPKESKGFFSDVAKSAGERIDNISNPQPSAVRDFSPTAGAALNVLGQVGGFAGDVIGAGIKKGYEALPESTQGAIAHGGKILATNPLVDAAGTSYNAIPEPVRNDLGNIVNATLINPTAKALGTLKPVAKEGVNIARDLGTLINPSTPIKKTINWIKPVPTEAEALGQILQGKTKDLAKGKKALNSIDTGEIKTYAELKGRIDEAIPEYARKVDEELLKDTKLYTLPELATEQKFKIIEGKKIPIAEEIAKNPLTMETVKHPSGGGFAVIDSNGKYVKGQGGQPAFYATQENADGVVKYAMDKAAKEQASPTISTYQKPTGIKVNYIQDALNHLSELYSKVGQKAQAVDMQNILAKAKTEGLTKKEVNDIARKYGSEFKAFNPNTGAPPTTVTKEMYENVRSGLKEVARRGLDDTTKELDSVLSSLYNTNNLVTKNMDAALRLRQKIDARGAGEKIGRALLTAMDVATLGIVKGAALKFIPRGLGYKVKNFIDLEESLKRNLKILNDGLNNKAIGKKEYRSATAKAMGKLGNPISVDGSLIPVYAKPLLNERGGQTFF
jgi:hypothetical protein